MTTPVVSIIISSYNYGRFIGQAIDSALGQTYPAVEVLVVDDGSTDDSPQIISEYGRRVTAVFQGNGGQASAFNKGFQLSRGSIVAFLDSDDALLPTAMHEAVLLFAPGVAKVHYPLWEVDEEGRRTGKILPPHPLPEGDLLDLTVRKGPDCYATSPTTGNVWARSFLQSVLPIPEAEYRTCPDGYLSTLAPLFGRIRCIPEPRGVHRAHQHNALDAVFHQQKIRMFEHRSRVLAQHLGQRGIVVDPNTWKRPYYTWIGRIRDTERDLAEILGPGERFILVDGDEFRREFALGRRAFPFVERQGEYWGPPPDDATAIRELERLRGKGATVIAFAWPAFWWLDHYTGFLRYLRDTAPCVLHNERVVAFELHTDTARSLPPADG